MEEDKKEIMETEEIENEEKTQEKTTNEKKDKKSFCIASLVLGIIALILFCIFYISIPCGILSIIFGILGIKSEGKGMAIAGIITGSIGLIISIAILIFIGLAIFFYNNDIGDNSYTDLEDIIRKQNIITDYDLYD